jgi:hypothetical protein
VIAPPEGIEDTATSEHVLKLPILQEREVDVNVSDGVGSGLSFLHELIVRRKANTLNKSARWMIGCFICVFLSKVKHNEQSLLP